MQSSHHRIARDASIIAAIGDLIATIFLIIKWDYIHYNVFSKSNHFVECESVQIKIQYEA